MELPSPPYEWVRCFGGSRLESLKSYPTDPNYKGGKLRILLSRSIWGGGKGRHKVSLAQKQVWPVRGPVGLFTAPSSLEQVLSRRGQDALSSLSRVRSHYPLLCSSCWLRSQLSPSPACCSPLYFSLHPQSILLVLPGNSITRHLT